MPRLRRAPLAVAADEEALPFRDGSLDLVVSALSLQFVNDLPGTLVQIRRALKPDGLFLAALVGGDTLTELRQAFAAAEAEIEGGVSPRVAPFADLRDLGALLQRAGFALPVTDVDRLTVRYASPLALMHDLRRMGATNALVERRRTPLRRATLARMMEIYGERFADPDGRMRATFEIVWLSGWAPHESQQQPLRPGSAQPRLADALGDEGRVRPARRRSARAAAPRGSGRDAVGGRSRGSTPWRRRRRRRRTRSARIRSRSRLSSVARRARAARASQRELQRQRSSDDLFGIGFSVLAFMASQQRRQMRDQRHVGRRHRIVLAAGSDAPRRASGPPAALTVPSQRRQT